MAHLFISTVVRVEALLTDWFSLQPVVLHRLDDASRAAITALLLAGLIQPPFIILCMRIVLRTQGRNAGVRGPAVATAMSPGGQGVPFTLMRAQAASAQVLLLAPLVIGVGIAGLPTAGLVSALFLALILFTLALLDAQHRWLPDRLVLAVAGIGLLAHFRAADTAGALQLMVSGVLVNFLVWVPLAWWLSGAGPAATAGASVGEPARSWRVMGPGDVKLIAAMAIWLPPLQMASALTAALAGVCVVAMIGLAQQRLAAVGLSNAAAGSVVPGSPQQAWLRSPRDADDGLIAFGPFLALGFWAVWCSAQGWAVAAY